MTGVQTCALPISDWIILRTPIRFSGSPEIEPGSLIIMPLGWFGDRLLFPVQWLGWALVALGVTALCWTPLLRGLTKSLSRMEHATAEIAHGRFATRVGLTRSDELGRLSSAIDAMAGRLDAMVTGQKRFLGDTAHELRSPLGRMQVALEILDRQATDADRAYIADLREDVDALSRMTDELLQFARADLADRSAPLERVHVAPVIDRVVAREGQGHAFSTSISSDVVVRAYPQLLERALSNVVRNAVKYAGQAGPITVDGAMAGEHTVITVSDLGPGVDAADIDRIFEPFYRADAARNRKTGGVGLGLAIVRSAIEACGGTVSCLNRHPHGLEVRITLESDAGQPDSSTATRVLESR